MGQRNFIDILWVEGCVVPNISMSLWGFAFTAIIYFLPGRMTPSYCKTKMIKFSNNSFLNRQQIRNEENTWVSISSGSKELGKNQAVLSESHTAQMGIPKWSGLVIHWPQLQSLLLASFNLPNYRLIALLKAAEWTPHTFCWNHFMDSSLLTLCLAPMREVFFLLWPTLKPAQNDIERGWFSAISFHLQSCNQIHD